MIKRASELQIQIDDVYACLGACAGCILSASERRSARPDMAPEILDLTINRLIEHASSMAPLKRVNLTFGIADHLQMSDEYVIDLHARGAQVVRAGRPTDPQHSGVFFTTSLIGKPAEVIARLQHLRDNTDRDVPLLPLVVLDPRLMKATKFGPMWREMVIAAREMFGEIDLSINLSDEAVAAMPPEELIAFADANAFNEVTVNWTPTLLNAHHTLANIEATRRWLVGFDEIARHKAYMGTSFRPVIQRTVDSIMCHAGADIPNMRETAAHILPETVSKSIEIDHLGYLMPKLEAVGDNAHSERFGLRSMGHLSEGSIASLISRFMPGMVRSVISEHSRGACAGCPVSALCAGTGFHVATHVLRATGHHESLDECPHVARTLIERIYGELSSQDHLEHA